MRVLLVSLTVFLLAGEDIQPKTDGSKTVGSASLGVDENGRLKAPQGDIYNGRLFVKIVNRNGVGCLVGARDWPIVDQNGELALPIKNIIANYEAFWDRHAAGFNKDLVGIRKNLDDKGVKHDLTELDGKLKEVSITIDRGVPYEAVGKFCEYLGQKNLKVIFPK